MGKTGQSLTKNKTAALAALMTAATVADAAAACGLTRRTLTGYLAQPDFRAALADAQHEAMEATTRRLVTECEASLDVVTDIRDGLGNDGVRLRAALAILDLAGKWQRPGDAVPDIDVKTLTLEQLDAIANGIPFSRVLNRL